MALADLQAVLSGLAADSVAPQLSVAIFLGCCLGVVLVLVRETILR